MRLDAAADVRSDAPVGSGGSSVGSGGVGAASGATGGNGGAGAALPSCEDCEKANCGAVAMLPDYYAACHDPKDSSGQPAKAKEGPAAGMLKKDLCEAVLSCVRGDPGKCVTLAIPSNGFEDISTCYCGTADQDTTCASGGANGACKAQIEAAAEVSSQSSAASDVGQRLVDADYAIGAAANLTNSCDLMYCRASCLGLPGPNRYGATAGTGGMGGSGGGGRGGGSGGAGGGTGTGAGSGGTGSGSGTGGTSGNTGGSGGSTVTYNACRSCEQSMCTEQLKSCEQAAGSAAAGPAAGTPRKDLCLAVVACVRATKCSFEGDVAPCFCGTADQNGPCQGGAANGPCKAQIEAAAESTDPAVVTGERFTNPDPQMKMPYAVGLATDLVGCDFFFCGSICVDGDPVNAGTGGQTGTGGSSLGGTGGSVATGGTTSTGGVSSTGGTTATGGVTGGGTGGAAGTATAGTGGIAGTGGVAGAGGGGTGGSSSGAGGALANGSFDTTAVPWVGEYAMTAAWTSSKDAAGSATSGALLVTNANVVEADGSTMGGARQCITVSGTAPYTLSAKLFIPSGQGTGSAGIDVLFFPSADCSGSVNGEYTSTLSTTTNAWTSIQGTTGVPSGAHSMAVRLVIVKTFRAAAFQAFFDNVSFAR